MHFVVEEPKRHFYRLFADADTYDREVAAVCVSTAQKHLFKVPR
jgi:hypothetical protein